MAKRWSFEEDYIVCKFCIEKQYDDIEGKLLDELVDRLIQKGFEPRSHVAVYKRARDFTFLLRGWESPYATEQARMIFTELSDKNESAQLRKNIKSYIAEVYNANAPTELDNSAYNRLSNMFDDADKLAFLGYTIKYESTFPMVLRKYVEIKGIKKHNVMCKRIGMKPDTFSAILRGKYPVVKKENVLRLCVGLELNIDQAEELLNSAGYILSDAIMMDVIIKAFLWNHRYYPGEINLELKDNNVPILFEHLKV